MLTPKEIHYGNLLLKTVRENRSKEVSQEMMSRGTLWRDNCITRLNERGFDNILLFTSYFKFGGVRDFYDMTNANILRIRKSLGKVSKNEIDFYNKFIRLPFSLIHATNSRRVINDYGDLVLYSRRNLQKKGIDFNLENTTSSDIIGLADDDYVFFSLSIGNGVHKKNSRFGNVFYKLDYRLPSFDFSSLMIFDALMPEMKTSKSHILSRTSINILSERSIPARHTVIFHNRISSLQALAGLTILTIRLLPESDQEKVLSLTSGDDINSIVHSFFSPIIRVPKILSARMGSFEVYK